MRIGNPQNFLDDITVRLRSMERAVAQYEFSAKQLKSTFENKLDQHTSLFIKGLGNEINLLSALRDLFFNSRELLDIVLGRLNRQTQGQATQAPKSFLPFAKQLANGAFDGSDKNIFGFLKNNITYIFHIRKIRNEIKNKPSNIEFRFVTDHFEAAFWVPVMSDEKELLQFLDIRNKDEALAKMSYHCTYNLDELFPEMLRFWKTCLSILERDFSL